MLNTWRAFAGMCPGNHESAGKRLSGKTRKGSQWLRTALVEAAHAASRLPGVLSLCPFPSYRRSSWEEASGCGPGSYPAGDYLPCHCRKQGV
ncbi:MAG: IS110 family transposase [Chloroflexi bacterium]|nr:MAG: IS110 family transposase [Chloroflexota bacterium]